MSSWRECKLGDVIDVKHGYAFKGENITTEKTSDILVTPGNFNIGGGFKSSKFKYFNGNYPEDYIFSEGDIVVTMTDLSKEGDTLGYSAKIPKCEDCKYLHNQRVGLIKFISNDVYKDFIYWLMRTREYQSFIVGAATGTSIRHTSPKLIKEYAFELPPLEEQKAIAEILSSLDDKIDLLHRQNKTLESLAQTLFRQWFIEEAKEEWEEQSLIDAVVLVGGGTPKTSVQEYWDGEIGWLAGGDISSHHKGFISKTEKTITQAGLKNSSTKLLPKYTTVISARGTVGKYCLLAKSMAFSQSNYGVMPKFEDCYFFTYLLISHSVEELQAAAYGSVFDTITTKTFQEHNITLPDEKTVKEFEKEMKPYFTKIESNTKQIQTLEKMRDVLLPKLLSGEVRIGG